MATHQVTIDVTARFKDDVTNPARAATKALQDLKKEIVELDKKPSKPKVEVDTGNANGKIDDTGKRLDETGKKHPKPRIDVDNSAANKHLEETERRAKKLSMTKVKMVLDAVDNASNTFRKIEDKARSFAGKTIETAIKVKDFALAPLNKIKNTLFSIKTLIAAVTAGFAAQKLIGGPLALADQYSSAKIGFSTLLGEDRGQQMMNDLDKFAKETPFNTSQVIAQSQKMIAMGWNAEDIIKDMKTIGDAAAATGKGDEGLGRIVLALSQIKSKGKLSTEELNQLAEAGISAKRYIAEGLGYGSGDEGLMKMTKDLEKGAIGAEAGISAIIEGMKEYNGMMNKTANETVAGLKSQIEDAFEISIFRRWGQGLQAGAKRGFGSFVELLDKSEVGLAKIGDLLYDLGSQLSNWFADKMQNAVKMATALTETAEFKNASLGGKIKILWDGLVADPLGEWWESTGKQKAAATAGKIGSWLGKTLSNVLLGVFRGTDALNDGLGEREGAGIAESFVRGFVDNFDGSAVADAFMSAIKNIWNALPTWAKFLVGGIGVSKATQGLSSIIGVGRGIASAGGAAIGVGKGIIGSTGNAMVGGSGISGWLASLGYAKMGGAGWGTMDVAGKSAALAGILPALGIVGGVAGAGTAISGGIDLYKGYKNDDETQKKSGAWKVGGAAGGAALGAALGSIIPGLGTLVGAGLGAGIGSAVGWWQSKKIKKDAAESIASMEELEEKAKSSEEAANELIRRQELVAKSIKENFGSISLSMEEIQMVAQNIALGGKAKELTAFGDAAKQAESSLAYFESAVQEINKLNWKASLGYEFNDDEKEVFKNTVEQYIASAEQVIEAEHYEFTAAVDLLLEPDSEAKTGIISSSDAFFKSMQEELDGLDKELTAQIKVALEDGKIDPESEAKVIADLQQQIADITNKVANAQAEAKLETLKIKFSSGQLDEASFNALQSELQTQLEQSTKTYDTALETSITSLKLQLDEGALSQEDYDAQIKALTDGYNANIGELKASAESIQFEILGGTFEDVLGEDATEKLQQALEQSISEGIQPVNWTQEQAANYLGVDSLEEGTALAIGQMLSSVAETMPESAAAVGSAIAEGITPSESDIAGMADETKGKADAALESSFAAGAQVDMPLTVNVNAKFEGLPEGLKVSAIHRARGGLIYPADSTVAGYADGGMVRGGGRLVRVAEEGTPEMIIPLGSQRRERGLKLWEKTGHMLGIPGFARGGLTGGEDEGLRYRGSGSVGDGGSGSNVEVNVGGVTVEIQMSGGDTNIVEAIKAQGGEIAETVAGILADAFSAQFENTPVRGGA